jgi:hypothetical protein
MKAISVLSIALTFLVISCLSHRATAQDWGFGIKGGINFANVNVDGGTDPDGKVGVHVGVFGNTPINADGNLYVQPELLFSLQGWEDANFTYINLPVVLKYYVADQFSIHGGLQLGVLIVAEDDRDEFAKTIDLGVPLGAEFDVNENFGLGLRYVIGATDINDTEGNDANVYNRVFQLFASYRFP